VWMAAGVEGTVMSSRVAGAAQASPFDRFLVRRRAEALASADTRTLKRALYGETQIALACA
jgi:hypothetical protein